MYGRGYTERNFELITSTINKLAKKIGIEPDDPNRAYFLKESFRRLSRSQSTPRTCTHTLTIVCGALSLRNPTKLACLK